LREKENVEGARIRREEGKILYWTREKKKERKRDRKIITDRNRKKEDKIKDEDV
jgi:hypothetical protein